MKGVELDEALHRALDYVFQDPRQIINTFSSVFGVFTMELIESMDEDSLEKSLEEVSRWGQVREMQQWIDLEISSGEDTLDSVVLGIVLNNLPRAGIIPRRKVDNTRDYQYQEIGAFKIDDEGRLIKIVSGQFPTDVSIDDVVFTPENLIYDILLRDKKLEWNVSPGSEPSLKLGEDLFLRRTAKTIVFRDKADDRTAKVDVKKVIKYAVDECLKGQRIKNRPYSKYEKQLVLALNRMIPSVLHENGRVNYRKLNSLFRLVRRRNLSLDGYLGDGAFLGKLNVGINKFIPLPYAVVRTRTKHKENAFFKIIEALYDLRIEGHKGGPKRFRDEYGMRIVLGTENDIYALVGKLRTTIGLKVIDEKDYIGKEEKPNEYQSYHMIVEYANRTYEIQLRTHEMDENAERKPKQARDIGYNKEKWTLINRTPLNVRRMVSILLDSYRPVSRKPTLHIPPS